jgi:serine phosphatase RsbU (regulator of sigma subunit)
VPKARGGDWFQRIRQFQEALRPKRPSATGRVAAEAAFHSAQGQLSGDFYDWIELDQADAFVIGDVTGHGLPSALVVAVLHGALAEALRYTQSPCRILNDIHGILAQLGERAGGPRIFSASLFVGVLQEDGRLVHANAGHPSPLILRRGQPTQSLDPVVPPLGLVPPHPCREQASQLSAGDRLLLYTDGLLPDGAAPEDLREEVDRLGNVPSEEIVRHLIAYGVDDDRTAVLVTHRGRR